MPTSPTTELVSTTRLTEAQRSTDDAKSQSDELSGKQARVRDLTRKLATKLGKENDAQEDK